MTSPLSLFRLNRTIVGLILYKILRNFIYVALGIRGVNILQFTPTGTQVIFS